MKKNHELIEVEAMLVHETKEGDDDQGAFLILAVNGKKDWVQKSRCTKTKKEGKQGVFIFEMPQSLAEDKGFV